MSTFKVAGIDHVVLHVKDLERSKRFYMDVLGFEFKSNHMGADGPMCFLSAGSQGLDLLELPDADIHGGEEYNHFAMPLVEGEREEVVEKLKALGIEVFGRVNDPKTMYLYDPDGHRLQLLSVSEQHRSSAASAPVGARA